MGGDNATANEAYLPRRFYLPNGVIRAFRDARQPTSGWRILISTFFLPSPQAKQKHSNCRRLLRSDQFRTSSTDAENHSSTSKIQRHRTMPSPRGLRSPVHRKTRRQSQCPRVALFSDATLPDVVVVAPSTSIFSWTNPVSSPPRPAVLVRPARA